MDDQGLPELLGDRDLSSERFFLGGVRRVVVVEVEAGLADRDHGRVGARVAYRVAELIVEVFGVVRMNTHGCRDSIRVLPRELDRRHHRSDVVRASDRGDAPHACVARPIEHSIELFEKARVVQVAMGVEEHRGLSLHRLVRLVERSKQGLGVCAFRGELLERAKGKP